MHRATLRIDPSNAMTKHLVLFLGLVAFLVAGLALAPRSAPPTHTPPPATSTAPQVASEATRSPALKPRTVATTEAPPATASAAEVPQLEQPSPSQPTVQEQEQELDPFLSLEFQQGRSPPVHTRPPYVSGPEHMYFKGERVYVHSRGTRIHFRPGARPHIVSTGGDTITLFRERVVDDIPYLLIGLASKTGRFRLVRVHDADGDGRIDTAAAETLFRLPTTYYLTDYTVADGRWYFLDSRSMDVWIARTEDGWPRGLHPTPFARSHDIPALAFVDLIRATSKHRVLCYSRHFAWERRPGGHLHAVLFADDESPGVTDHYAFSNSYRVETRWQLHDGQTQIQYWCELPDPVSIWTRAHPRALWEVLVPPRKPQEDIVYQAVSLDRPLRAGEEVQFRWRERRLMTTTVRDAEPQLRLRRLTREELATKPPGGLHLSSRNADGCLLWIRSAKMHEPARRLDYEMDPSGHITVSLPTLPNSWHGECDVWLTDRGYPRMLGGVSIRYPLRR